LGPRCATSLGSFRLTDTCKGMFVKHIQQETGTRVQIKGLGSGFYESESGRESDEPMHIHITLGG